MRHLKAIDKMLNAYSLTFPDPPFKHNLTPAALGYQCGKLPDTQMLY